MADVWVVLFQDQKLPMGPGDGNQPGGSIIEKILKSIFERHGALALNRLDECLVERASDLNLLVANRRRSFTSGREGFWKVRVH